MKGLFYFLPIIFLSGCATAQAPSPKISGNLESRIVHLEQQLVQKDQEMEELKYEVKELAYQVETLDTSSVIEPMEHFLSKKSSTKRVKKGKAKSKKITKKNSKIIRVNVDVKKIQIALKRAGYYSGSIDGKIGSQTKKAVKEFQKGHELKADGIIGKQTWTEMKNYLE